MTVQKHKVKVVYSDKDEDRIVSKGYENHDSAPVLHKTVVGKKYEQHINVKASSKHEAVNKAALHITKNGFRVHSTKHVGIHEGTTFKEVTDMQDDCSDPLPANKISGKYAPKKLRDIVPKPAKAYHEYKGNTPDEKAIVARYDDNTVRHPDRNGNGDDVFKASKIERDEKAVVPGDDEKKYKEWNSGAS